MARRRRPAATVVAAVVAVTLAAVTMAGCGGSEQRPGGRCRRWWHPRLRLRLRPEDARRCLCQRRRVVAADPADLRDAGDDEAGRHRHRARARRVLAAERGRPDLDVQPASGRDLPGRHPVQRGRGLHQLRPLVQLHRDPAKPGGVLLLEHRLRRVREQRGPQARPQPVQVLRGPRRQHGRVHPHLGVFHVPVRAEPSGVLHRQPGRTEEVQRRPDRWFGRLAVVLQRLRYLAPDRHRALPAGELQPQRPAGAQALRRLLGGEGQARPGHLQADRGRQRPPADAAVGRDPRL